MMTVFYVEKCWPHFSLKWSCWRTKKTFWCVFCSLPWSSFESPQGLSRKIMPCVCFVATESSFLDAVLPALWSREGGEYQRCLLSPALIQLWGAAHTMITDKCQQTKLPACPESLCPSATESVTLGRLLHLSVARWPLKVGASTSSELIGWFRKVKVDAYRVWVSAVLGYLR